MLSDFFSPNTICFICNNKAGLNKNKTSYGYICWNCLKKLSKHNINILNIKKFSVEELKNKVNTSTSTNISSFSEHAPSKTNYILKNVDLAEQLFNTQVLGETVDSIYKHQVNKILKQCTPKNKQYPERQQVLLKVIDLIGEPATPKERFLVAKAYSWSRVEYREKAIHYLELYLNNELYKEAYIHQFRNINDTEEIQKKYHLNEMYGYLAKAYIGTYDLAKALEIYEYLISIFPKHPLAYRGKCECLIKQNKLKECYNWLIEVQKLPYYKLNKKYSETAPENWFYYTINSLLNDVTEKLDNNYVYKSRKK